jgi:hypothetical protein
LMQVNAAPQARIKFSRQRRMGCTAVLSDEQVIKPAPFCLARGKRPRC